MRPSRMSCGVTAALSRLRWRRCLQTAQGIMGRRPWKKPTEGERGICAGGKKLSVAALDEYSTVK